MIDGLVCTSTGTSTRRGVLTVVHGCMFSGKTTELLRRLAVAPAGAGIALKHQVDQRYQAKAVVSHNGASWPAVPVSKPSQIIPHLHPRIVLVAIDEAHFFSLDLVEVVAGIVATGRDVVITTLDRDSWGRPFAVAGQLVALGDVSLPMCAVCARCGTRADRTQRLTPIVDGNMVGGPESYEPRCQQCWMPPP